MLSDFMTEAELRKHYQIKNNITPEQWDSLPNYKPLLKLIYKRHFPHISSLLSELIYDEMNDALLYALVTYEPSQGNLVSWIYKLALNRAARFLKAKKRRYSYTSLRRRNSNGDIIERVIEDHRTNSIYEKDKEYLFGLIQKAATKLSRYDRELFDLFCSGEDFNEIALELNTSAKCIRQRFAGMKRRLATILSKMQCSL